MSAKPTNLCLHLLQHRNSSAEMTVFPKRRQKQRKYQNVVKAQMLLVVLNLQVACPMQRHVQEKNVYWADESKSVKDQSSNLASYSESYNVALQEVACSMPELGHNYHHGWGSYAGNNWLLNSNELPNLPSLDLGQESSEFLMHCIGDDENHEVIPVQVQSSMGLNASPSVILGSDEPEQFLLSEDGYCRLIYPEAEVVERFSSGNLTMCPNASNFNGSENTLVYQPSNYQISDALNSEMLGISCSQPFAVPSQHPADDGVLVFGSDSNQFNDLSHENREEEIANSPNDGFIYTGYLVNSPFDNEKDNMGLQGEPDQAKESLKLVPVDAFSPGPSNNNPTCSLNENSTVLTAQKDTGALFYEPPRFPSLEIPFFSCDLIQSGNDMQQEYSPLGIRQLMMSSGNCFSPFRLWDSPLRDGSPDAVLKSAAKTFTCTPSILKKRNRDLVSPMSEKRIEKKLESGVNQESFSSLARDFSRLDVMFDDNGTHYRAPFLSPSSNQTRKSGKPTYDKENVDCALKAGKEETGDDITAENTNSEKESVSVAQNVSFSAFVCVLLLTSFPHFLQSD